MGDQQASASLEDRSDLTAEQASLEVPRTTSPRARPSPLFAVGQAPHPVVFSIQGQVYSMFPDGSDPHDLNIQVGTASPVMRVGGRFSHGAEAPVLSPDHRLLAYLDNGNLFVAALEQPVPIEALRARAGREAIVINSWTPDGSRLLAYVENNRTGEGEYREVDGSTFEVSRLPHILRANAWTMDSGAVLFDRTEDDAVTLYRQSVDDGETTPIAVSTGISAFRPLTSSLGVLAYLDDHHLCTLPEQGGESQVVARSTEPTEIIRPLVSPDGRHVAFFWDRQDSTGQAAIAVVDLDSLEIRRIAECSSRCEFQWYDSEHLLFTNARHRLILSDLSGQQMPLADGAQLVGIGRPIQH